jgi:hypothetical protein
MAYLLVDEYNCTEGFTPSFLTEVAHFAAFPLHF